MATQLDEQLLQGCLKKPEHALHCLHGRRLQPLRPATANNLLDDSDDTARVGYNGSGSQDGADIKSLSHSLKSCSPEMVPTAAFRRARAPY